MAAGINLAENPNRGKRHGARLEDRTLAADIREDRRQHHPLTVATAFQRRDGSLFKDRRRKDGSAHRGQYSVYSV